MPGVTLIELAGPSPDGHEPAVEEPFDGHEICSGDEYLNGVTAIESKYFHPNVEGYERMEELLSQTWTEIRGD